MRKLQNKHTDRVLRLPDVIEKAGITKPTVYRLMREGVFPKNFLIGQRAVGWSEQEIDAYLAERMDRRAAKKARA